MANLRAGFVQERGHWRLSEFARLDNLANRAYVGSVIVNETNSRFFEPAPGRTAYIMFNAVCVINLELCTPNGLNRVVQEWV